LVVETRSGAENHRSNGRTLVRKTCRRRSIAATTVSEHGEDLRALASSSGLRSAEQRDGNLHLGRTSNWLLRLRPFPILVATLLAAACGGGSEGSGPGEILGTEIDRAPAEPTDAPTLAGGLTEFALDYHALRAQREPGENLVFSPLSLAMAFGMADAGARGETAAQIEEVFHLPTSGQELHAAFNALEQALASSGTPTLRLANRLFPATGYELEPDFVETLAAQYGAPPERLDFAGAAELARERINAWVSERTEKRIPELFPAGAIDPATRLVLVNALYLKAKWMQPFGKYPTERAPFTRLDGSTVRVSLMQNAELQTRFVDAKDVQAVELPYEGGKLSMLVVVPRGDFAAFERSFDAARLAGLDEAARTGIADLYLPRWSTSSSLDLAGDLPELGLTAPFGTDRDFTGISPDNPVLDAAVHAADIDVDERGTVAAAATGLAFAVSGPPTPDAVIRADRPFLYLIRDTETGAILFAGRLVDP
jgi:serpin B